MNLSETCFLELKPYTSGDLGMAGVVGKYVALRDGEKMYRRGRGPCGIDGGGRSASDTCRRRQAAGSCTHVFSPNEKDKEAGVAQE